MRVLAGAFLAVLATGPALAESGPLAVTLAVQPAVRSCAVVSTATIVAYDPRAQHDVAYRFVRSDGTVSATGRLAFTGEGAVALAVRDSWTPRGPTPWVALEIVAPQHVRSRHVAVAARCPRRVIAATH